MEILTRREAQILAAARFVLDSLEQRLSDMVPIPSEAGTIKPWDVFSAGHAKGVASVAGDALFYVLNVVSSHLHDPLAEEFVHVRLDPAALDETPFAGAEA